MKNAKLKFSEYMQNISSSKSFGISVLIVLAYAPQPFSFSEESNYLFRFSTFYGETSEHLGSPPYLALL